MNFDDIHNYYERLVINYIVEVAAPAQDITDDDLIVDIACIALNRLPARYIRHDVDMAFFLTSDEREKMQTLVIDEVANAIKVVLSRQQDS